MRFFRLHAPDVLLAQRRYVDFAQTPSHLWEVIWPEGPK
jgi:hypothetical protein